MGIRRKKERKGVVAGGGRKKKGDNGRRVGEGEKLFPYVTAPPDYILNKGKIQFHPSRTFYYVNAVF